jgi:hypothetical protein
MRPSRTSWVTVFPRLALMLRCDSGQASVVALSIICRWTLLQCWQVNVRKSWPAELGSIAVSFIGEPQAVHWGPWFWLSSIAGPRSIRRFEFARKPATHVGFNRVARNNHRVSAAALRAIESSIFEAGWSRLDFRMKHPWFVALRTPGPVDIGKIG